MTYKQGTLRANGLDIATLASFRTEHLESVLRVAAKRTEDIEIPDEDGQLYVPDKRHEANELVLPMWVHGCLPDGSLPTGGQLQGVYDRADELIEVFGEDRIVLEHERPDGSIREITGEVLDRIDWTRKGLHGSGQVSILLHCADPFWYAPDAVTATIVAAGADTTQALDEFTGISARLVDLVVRFTAAGACPNPAIQQTGGGHFLRYGSTLTDAVVEVDSGTWDVVGGAYEDIEHTDSTARYFVLKPQRPVPEVTVSHTGAGTLTTTLTGRKRFKHG